jgi:hypothetical protein
LDGLWRVILLIDQGEDETNDVAGFHFDFAEGGVVTAISTADASQTFDGAYSLLLDDGQTELAMNFPIPNTLDELNDDWYFIEGSTSLLVFEDNQDDPPSALTLEKVTSGGNDEGGNNNGGDNGGNNGGETGEPGSEEEVAAVQQALINNGWIVALLIDDNEDETPDLVGYILNFDSNGTVTATLESDPNFTQTGTFSVFSDDNRTELAMNFTANDDLQNLSDDWYFIEMTSNTLVFEDDQTELVNALTLQQL